MIVKGVVNNKSFKFDKHAIVVDGGTGLGELWYSSKFDINCQIGDMVEFDSGPEGKKWCSKLKVLSSGNPVKDKEGNVRAPSSVTHTAGAPAARGGMTKGFGEPKLSTQRSIIRQNAVTNANAFLTATGMACTSIEELIKLAKEIEEYTAGDMEAKAFKAKADEQAKAAAEAQEKARKEAEARRIATEAEAPAPTAPAVDADPFDALFD
jgi:hypothetical protein